MGSAIARNLIKAGYTLSVFNRTRARADELKALGARVAATPGQAAAGAEVAITMLADDYALEALIFGKGNLLDSLPPNAKRQEPIANSRFFTVSPKLGPYCALPAGCR